MTDQHIKHLAQTIHAAMPDACQCIQPAVITDVGTTIPPTITVSVAGSTPVTVPWSSVLGIPDRAIIGRKAVVGVLSGQPVVLTLIGA